KPENNVVEVVGPDGAPVPNEPAPTSAGPTPVEPGADRSPQSSPAGGAAGSPAPPSDAEPLPGLTENERERFRAGLAAFERVETPESGLGPLFNGTSCGECHLEPRTGGASDRTVRMIAVERRVGDPAARPGADLPLRTRGVRTAQCSAR